MNYRAKKRFGQHFLHDQGVIDKIIRAADLEAGQRVVEIGPGQGVLTERLLERGARVEVMEIDRDLVEGLRLRQHPELVIHQGDVLKLPWSELLANPPYTLVANLPYNISSQVLFRLLDHRRLFPHMVLMFQREVGQRLIAPPGGKDYGILSVLIQLWYRMEVVTLVKPGAFRPPPRVDSMVLSFDLLPAPQVDPVDEILFRKLVKGAFTQRRKTVRNSLLAAGFTADAIDFALAGAQINPIRRGETLTLEEFSALARLFI